MGRFSQDDSQDPSQGGGGGDLSSYMTNFFSPGPTPWDPGSPDPGPPGGPAAPPIDYTPPDIVTTQPVGPRVVDSGSGPDQTLGRQIRPPAPPDPSTQPIVTGSPAPAGVDPNFRNGLILAYQQYLGRTPSDAELQAHYANPGGFQGALNTIKNSTEAWVYAHSPHNPNTGGNGGGSNTTTTGSGSNAQQYLQSLLASGMDPQQAIAQTNSTYGLGSSSSAAYYGPGAHGPGSGAVIGLAGYGGYFAQNPDGSWGWVTSAEQNGGGGGGSSVSSGLNPSGGTTFGDPAYQQLNDMVQQMLGKLNQPVSFPQLDQYMQMLQQNEAQQQQIAQTFADQLSQRVQQLDQPLLSDANVANIRALASNNLLAQRDAAIKNAQQQRYASGFAPTSGLLDYDTQNINQQYSNAQSNIDAQLQANQIQGDEQRRNLATNLQGLAAQALAGGNVAALGSQAQAADLENQLYNLNNQRNLEALTTAQIPVDLTNQGYANAVNGSNLSSNPLNSILSLLALGNQQQGLQQDQANSNMGALALLLREALG